MNRLKVISKEVVLGALVTALTIITAAATYQSAMADSDQTKNNVQGQRLLTEASADYLTGNQAITYDLMMYDGWRTNEDAKKAEYYKSNFSQELEDSLKTSPDDPFNEAYVDAMQIEQKKSFASAYKLFDLAEKFNERGDELQLVALISTLGLACTAWAALLDEESKVRLAFAIFSIVMLVFSIVLYIKVPTVTI